MPFARRRQHKIKKGTSRQRRSPRSRAGSSLLRVQLALGDDDALAALFNDRWPAASRRLLAHFDRAHPVLGLDPHGKAAATDDDAHVRRGTLLDDPTTLGRRFLNDVEVRQ